MIGFLNIVTLTISAVKTFILYQILKQFFPMRDSLPFRIVAVFPCYIIIEALILPQDIIRMVFFFICFLIYINLFYKGNVVKKYLS